MGDRSVKPNLAILTDLDRLIHEPARLAIMALLFVLESADFNFAVNQTGLSWGNLSTHMSKLEGAIYIKVEKSFKGRRPNTNLHLTDAGRKVFMQYRSSLKQMLNDLSG